MLLRAAIPGVSFVAALSLLAKATRMIATDPLRIGMPTARRYRGALPSEWSIMDMNFLSLSNGFDGDARVRRWQPRTILTDEGLAQIDAAGSEQLLSVDLNGFDLAMAERAQNDRAGEQIIVLLHSVDRSPTNAACRNRPCRGGGVSVVRFVQNRPGRRDGRRRRRDLVDLAAGGDVVGIVVVVHTHPRLSRMFWMWTFCKA